MSVSTSSPRVTLPSIHQLLMNIEPNNTNFDAHIPNIIQTEKIMTNNFKPTPVQKPMKMKQNLQSPAPKYAVDTFDIKTFDKIKTENTIEASTGEKPKWIFETGIFQKRGRKGKAKDWQLNIAKISKQNK
eukprot:gene8118-12579_t